MSTHEKRILELRTLRGKIHSQNMQILNSKGVLYIENPIRCVDLQEYKAQVLKNAIYRMNRKSENHDKRNAERACDIIKHGDKAAYWKFRHSTSHAGSNTRGIVHYVRKYKPELLET